MLEIKRLSEVPRDQQAKIVPSLSLARFQLEQALAQRYRIHDFDFLQELMREDGRGFLGFTREERYVRPQLWRRFERGELVLFDTKAAVDEEQSGATAGRTFAPTYRFPAGLHVAALNRGVAETLCHLSWLRNHSDPLPGRGRKPALGTGKATSPGRAEAERLAATLQYGAFRKPNGTLRCLAVTDRIVDKLCGAELGRAFRAAMRDVIHRDPQRPLAGMDIDQKAVRDAYRRWEQASKAAYAAVILELESAVRKNTRPHGLGRSDNPAEVQLVAKLYLQNVSQPQNKLCGYRFLALQAQFSGAAPKAAPARPA
ncbi:MAG: hypothetical protein AB7Q97_08300 [Gammaproteobacteria bacterium]